MEKKYEIIGPPKENISSQYPQGYSSWPSSYDKYIGRIAIGSAGKEMIIINGVETTSMSLYLCEVKEVSTDWDE